jgi:hypothetical protein
MSGRQREGGPNEPGHEWDAARDPLIGNWPPPRATGVCRNHVLTTSAHLLTRDRIRESPNEDAGP